MTSEGIRATAPYGLSYGYANSRLVYTLHPKQTGTASFVYSRRDRHDLRHCAINSGTFCKFHAVFFERFQLHDA